MTMTTSALDQILGGREWLAPTPEAVAACQTMCVGEIDGLANPYLDAWATLGGPWGYDVPFTDERFEMEMTAVMLRRFFVVWFAWAIPTDDALDLIGKTGDVVEIGAGGGYWAAMLRARDATVYAYDRAPHDNHHVAHGWSPVERGFASAAARHPDATLLLCWPPYGSPLAHVAVERYYRAGGRRVAYVGEDDGCTGISARLEALEPVDDVWLPQWPGIHDRLRVFEL